jgi:hypothetical protein
MTELGVYFGMDNEGVCNGLWFFEGEVRVEINKGS